MQDQVKKVAICKSFAIKKVANESSPSDSMTELLTALSLYAVEHCKTHDDIAFIKGLLSTYNFSELCILFDNVKKTSMAGLYYKIFLSNNGVENAEKAFNSVKVIL